MTPQQVDALVTAHLELARAIAAKIKHRLPPFIEMDDLAAEAYVGLHQAALRYRPETNVPFDAFARPRIRGAVMDSIRRRNFKHTSTAQISEFPDQVHALQVDQMTAVEERMDRRARALEVRRAVATLPETDRKVIELRYWRGMTGKDAGAALGKGESRSSQMHQNALRSLRSNLERSPHISELKRAA